MRRQRGLELGGRVQVGRLLDRAPGRALVGRRDRDDLDPVCGSEPLDRLPQRLLAVAEVRAEPDEGPHAGYVSRVWIFTPANTEPVENALVPSAWFSACADEATSVAFRPLIVVPVGVVVIVAWEVSSRAKTPLP